MSTSGAPGDELVTIEQAGQRYRVSPKTLRRRLGRGEIPGAFKRPGPTGTEWALPVASLESLGYQRLAAGERPVADVPAAGDDVAAQRDAWQQRALEAEALAEEQAAVLDELARAKNPRSSKVDERAGRRGGLIIVVAVLVAFLSFVAGIVFAGLGDEGEEEGRAPPGSAATTVSTAAAPSSSTTGAVVASPAEATTTTLEATTTTQVRAPEPEPPLPPAVEPESASAAAVSEPLAPGGSFWTVAEDHVTDSLGRAPTDAEIGAYWLDLIDANRSSLPDPGNPDLLYVGTTLVLPAMT